MIFFKIFIIFSSSLVKRGGPVSKHAARRAQSGTRMAVNPRRGETAKAGWLVWCCRGCGALFSAKCAAGHTASFLGYLLKPRC